MKDNKIEFFTYSLSADKEENKLSGYAVLFDTKSKLMNMYGQEYFTKIGKDSLYVAKNDDMKLLLEHDHTQILAREKNGSLKVFSDDKGIRFEAELGNSMLQRDVVELVRQGIYTQMSFGVLIDEQSWEEFSDGPPVRTITKGQMFEFSVVSSPLFEETSVNLMVASDKDTSAESYFKQKEQAENDKLLLSQQKAIVEMLAEF